MLKNNKIRIIVSFKGNISAGNSPIKLRKTAQDIYPAADIMLSFYTRQILVSQLKDKPPSSSLSLSWFISTAASGIELSSWIGRTTNEEVIQTYPRAQASQVHEGEKENSEQFDSGSSDLL